MPQRLDLSRLCQWSLALALALSNALALALSNALWHFELAITRDFVTVVAFYTTIRIVVT